jgi:hypothetical protein
MSQECQPRGTVGTRLWSEVAGEDPADHILINRCSKSQIDLIGNLGASPSRISLFHLDDSTDQIRNWAFGTWSSSLLWRKQQPILSLNQSAMETQQRGWLEGDCDSPEPTRLDPKRTECGNEPIPNAEIRRPASSTVQDQQLMLGKY